MAGMPDEEELVSRRQVFGISTVARDGGGIGPCPR